MNAAFDATLSPRERRLAGRLEGFGDIVFGFAVSQCALQLPTSGGFVDLGRAAGLASYFVTFALLAVLWLTYHRILSGTYKPTGTDLILAFAYLALVSLMPYAMYSVSHERSLAGARTAVGEYSLLFSSTMGVAALLTLRNLRRGFGSLDDDERAHTWRAFLRRAVTSVMMGLGFATDLIFGPTATFIPFLSIFVVMWVVRTRFNKAPSFAR